MLCHTTDPCLTQSSSFLKVDVKVGIGGASAPCKVHMMGSGSGPKPYFGDVGIEAIKSENRGCAENMFRFGLEVHPRQCLTSSFVAALERLGKFLEISGIWPAWGQARR